MNRPLRTGIPLRARRIRAFSLLELIVVLVLMGMAVGLVAPAVTRNAGAGREQRSLGELATTLSAARLDAIRTGRTVNVELTAAKNTLLVRHQDELRTLANWPLALLDSNGNDIENIALTFDIRGRTAQSRLSFRSREAPSRMWEIAFDPVGGVPAAHRLTEDSAG